MDDRDFARLLSEFNLSWAGYRKVRKGVKKRVRRHMEEAGCRRMDEYLEFLRADAAAREESRRRLGVTISRFFRDRLLWEVLEEELLPDLRARHAGVLKVWSAGCACGEEAYSISMVWEKGGYPGQLEITATDRKKDCLGKAREGIYPVSSLKEMKEEERLRYFDKVPGKKLWAVKEGLRCRIDWQEQDLLRDAPPDRFHIIFLRNNLLTYYKDKEKLPALRRILECMVPAGFLILGTHEKLPAGIDGFQRREKPPYVYRKEAGS